jgi:hypothetical protein
VLDGTANPRAKFTIETDGIAGLFGGVGVRGERIPLPSAHGDYDLPVYREARLLKFSGDVNSDGLSDQQKDLSRLGAVLADGQKSTLAFQADGGPRRCSVRLADTPDIEVVVPGKFARYQLQLIAPDPRMYGEDRSFTGGDVQAYHYGNFPAKIQAVVRGPRPAGYEIQGPGGRRVVVAQSLGPLDHHTIQFWSGRVYRNGTRQLGALTVFQPWTVPPGLPTAMSCPSGEMTINISDTYI